MLLSKAITTPRVGSSDFISEEEQDLKRWVEFLVTDHFSWNGFSNGVWGLVPELMCSVHLHFALLLCSRGVLLLKMLGKTLLYRCSLDTDYICNVAWSELHVLNDVSL